MSWWRRRTDRPDGSTPDGRDPDGTGNDLAERVRDLTTTFVALAGRDEPGTNVVVSGAGVHAALLVLAAGAGGEVLAPLRACTGSVGPTAGSALADLDARLRDLAGVGHATGLWSRAALHDTFVASLPTVGVSPGTDRAELDTWTRDHTLGMVERFPCELRPSTRLALADATALVGSWAQPFDPAATRPRPFTLADGTAREVATMHATGTVGGWRRGDTTVVALVGADDGDRPGVHLRVGLGPMGGRPSTVLGAVLGRPGRPLDGMVELRLPRFAIRDLHDLGGLLDHLGLAAATTDERTFAGATDEPLVLDQAVQEAVVEVDEHGVRAAAVTAMTAQRGGPPPRTVAVHVDRPFAFAVVDPVDDLALFAGWIADPTAS